MAFNPNAIFVSPSSLSDLEKCPQLYYLRNVYKSPQGLKIQLTNPNLALGQAVHDVISQFLALEPMLRSKNELFRILDLVWGGVTGDKGGFASPDEEKEYRDRASVMLERFWGDEHFHTSAGVKIPNFPKVELGDDLILTGKLDWIEMGNEGEYQITDFKTGKNKEKEDSLQLPIYAILIGDIFKTKNIKARYWYLDQDGPMEDVALPDMDYALGVIKKKANIAKMVRMTQSFRCQSGGESCWACRDMLAISKGEGKLVGVDMGRKQEIYILPKAGVELQVEDLPF